MLRNFLTAFILANALLAFGVPIESDIEWTTNSDLELTTNSDLELTTNSDLELTTNTALESLLKDKRKDVCRDGKVDAATRTKDGSDYFFKDDYYWKYTEIDGGIVYLGLIADDWIGVQGPIDAAFTWDDGATFLFKGKDYWKFVNKDPLPGYPRRINDGFRGIPNDLDAALVWSKNGVTYFFKADQYWRYDPKASPPTDGKPSFINAWRGVPNFLDAAIRWKDGLTYFFKGSSYYRYDNDVERVNRNNYPSSTVKAWFDCDKQTTLWKEFERELPKEVEKTPKDVLEAVSDLKSTIEGFSTEIRTKQMITDVRLIKLMMFLKGSSASQNLNDEQHNDILNA